MKSCDTVYSQGLIMVCLFYSCEHEYVTCSNNSTDIVWSSYEKTAYVCHYYSIVSLSVLYSEALSKWLHVMSNGLLTLKATVPQTGKVEHMCSMELP